MEHTNVSDENEKGLCITSFDGGGPGTFSQLAIMQEIMGRVAHDLDVEEDAPRPADYWDLMGGVGFGGLCALLLGRLRMTVEEAMEELATIGTTIFPENADSLISPEENAKRTREALEDMLRRHRFPTDLKLRDNLRPRCKVIVFAAPAAIPAHRQPFRTYRTRCNSGFDCSFVEAACAVIGDPQRSAPVSIGPRWAKQKFIGIPYGFSNPMREVLNEARLIYGDDKRVSLVLSLGSGQQTLPPNLGTWLTRITYDRDTVEKELSHQLDGVGAYLRLNVDKGVVNGEDSNWHNLGLILSHTNAYLQMNAVITYVDEVVRCLRSGTGGVTLGQLGGTSRVANVRSDSQELKNYLDMKIKRICDIHQQGAANITLVDAIGNNIAIPMEFCSTYAYLADFLYIYFKNRQIPGLNLVKRGDYQLISNEQSDAIMPSGWTTIRKPGMTVEMSMVRHDSNNHGSKCPRCGMGSTGLTKNEWATWKVPIV